VQEITEHGAELERAVALAEVIAAQAPLGCMRRSRHRATRCPAARGRRQRGCSPICVR